MSLVTTAPVRSISRGTRVAGPHSHSFAPILPREWRSDRTTRLCRISPTMAILRPAIFPFTFRIV